MSFITPLIQTSGSESDHDVFVPIAKYIQQGDADKLSAWFADNLEVTLFTYSNESSRNQAKQIMKTFFKNYTPRKFVINHKVTHSNLKYAVGTLNAGGESFLVTIFVGSKPSTDIFQIQQIKIEKME